MSRGDRMHQGNQTYWPHVDTNGIHTRRPLFAVALPMRNQKLTFAGMLCLCEASKYNVLVGVSVFVLRSMSVYSYFTITRHHHHHDHHHHHHHHHHHRHHQHSSAFFVQGTKKTTPRKSQKLRKCPLGLKAQKDGGCQLRAFKSLTSSNENPHGA